MADLGHFDATSVEPTMAFDIVPADQYRAHIVNSEMKTTKDGTGKFLSLEIAILDGPYANRRIFDRLNLVNANATAENYAQRKLSSICHAVGKLHVSDSEQLHNHAMIVKVTVKPAGPDRSGIMRDAQNEVKGYESIDAAPSSAFVRPAPTTTTAAAPAAGTLIPPWRRPA